MAASHLLQHLTDVAAERGRSWPLLKTHSVRLRWPCLALVIPALSLDVVCVKPHYRGWGAELHLCKFLFFKNGFDEEEIEDLSCATISISFFCLSGPEDVTLGPSGAMTTWLLQARITSLQPSVRSIAN